MSSSSSSSGGIGFFGLLWILFKYKLINFKKKEIKCDLIKIFLFSNPKYIKNLKNNLKLESEIKNSNGEF